MIVLNKFLYKPLLMPAASVKSSVLSSSLYQSKTMNLLAVTIIFGAAVSVVSSHPQKYSDKYDNVDIDSILKNDRVLMSYVNCILDKGPCTQEGRDFRKHLPEAIETNCEKCTNGQKKIVRKAASYLMKNKKAEWEQIRKKYDPVNQHYDDFLKFLNGS